MLNTTQLEQLRQAAGNASGLMKVLANPDRLLLLCQLVDGELCVSDFEARTGITQPTLSQQLGVLRNEGLVETRRDGKRIFYRLASDNVLRVLRVLYEIYCPAPDAAQSDSH
ncbi:transcriptional regulator, ArsR family [Andreprevotia lacus DSM 23236]|jgi:ArsR family transcriptional regulator|uniref:Transcriptional regulator, ArsR family n=1 Tax=Andreprevotia lacus DSM 23236 TaxID=1121001 RepID=A0A1W1XI27_9NEIS|nr:metalloregulator ArsR/SmtB family transcription factor [Andreprevotia lacus]SMC23158.1 transcriptional regulator, ArsR family [Andreprevotia lacus DSM 23236]